MEKEAADPLAAAMDAYDAVVEAECRRIGLIKRIDDAEWRNFCLKFKRTDAHTEMHLEKLMNKNKKRKRGDTSCNGKFVIPTLKMRQATATREKERSKILHNNIQQLVANNSPKMSKKQKEWLDRYNKWASGPGYSFWAKFPGGRPPLRKSWDPVACARIRNKKHFSRFVVRVAEMAIQFYNKNHEGSDFEVVEIVSANEFQYVHRWVHINFRAKPKNASGVRSFFAEHFNDDFGGGWGGCREKITEGVISTCCLMKKGSTTNGQCGYCRKACKVLHPINDGFVFHPNVDFKVSAN